MTRRAMIQLWLGVLTWSVLALPAAAAGPRQKSKRPAAPKQAAQMVRMMVAARAKQRPIAVLTQKFGPFSLDDAYRIQDLLARRLTPQLGPVTGYKVAYASKAAQEQFGIDQPAAGPLFLSQRLPSGSTISTKLLMNLLLETEVAFTLARRVDRPVADVGALKPLVRWVHPAFDVGESRFREGDAPPTVQDMVASGLAAHMHVIGPAMDPAAVDVDELSLQLIRNGEVVRESPSRNVMGSPWNSLLWLVNSVVARGGSLPAGAVVITGTAAPAYRAAGQEVLGQYVGDCGELGRVTLTIR